MGSLGFGSFPRFWVSTILSRVEIQSKGFGIFTIWVPVEIGSLVWVFPI